MNRSALAYSRFPGSMPSDLGLGFLRTEPNGARFIAFWSSFAALLVLRARIDFAAFSATSLRLAFLPFEIAALAARSLSAAAERA